MNFVRLWGINTSVHQTNQQIKDDAVHSFYGEWTIAIFYMEQYVTTPEVVKR